MRLMPTRIDQGRTPCEDYVITRSVRGGLLHGGIMEEWRACFYGFYEVSNLGNVKRIKGGSGAQPGRLLIPVEDQRSGDPGYPTVELKCADPIKRRTCYVHALVAEAFIGPRPEGLEVNHKNGIKNDNRSVNLEWVTKSRNRKHAFEIGLRTPTYGTIAGTSKLTEEDVKDIRRRREAGEKLNEIAADYPVNIGQISNICLGKNWTHLL